MKKFSSYLCVFILGGIIFSTLSVFAVTQILSSNISYDNTNSGLEATNAQDAIDEIYKNYRYRIGDEWDFDYTGGEQTFNIPVSGTYKLEVWGGQGGYHNTNSLYGGYGAYSVGTIKLSKNSVLYINVGGQGAVMSTVNNSTGGYNGGGTGYLWANGLVNGGGGGATHIAIKSGVLSSLSSSIDSIYIVAGGGGGSSTNGTVNHVGGNAGGIQGNDGVFPTNNDGGNGLGGTQTAGGKITYNATYRTISLLSDNYGSFGQGGQGWTNSTAAYGGAGGGGGFYGGGGSVVWGGAGGGSSYIGNSLLTDKVMYCYNCTTSTDESTKTISNTCVNSTATENCSKTGNGYAKITLVSNN